MKLVVGLGNPGPKYELTRHNVGFLAVDRLVEKLKAQGPVQKFEAEIFTAKLEGEPVVLAKPQTFMNLSGRSVAALASFYKIEPSDIVVLHDELDLPPLALRLKTGGGPGGHNGLKSIDQCMGAGKQAYHRIRIGIGQGLLPTGRKIPAEQWVLDPFTDDELKQLDGMLNDICEATTLVLRGEMTRAMNRFNASPKEKG
jgi:peptidyl-tRNA hydrolase, PTH1 family